MARSLDRTRPFGMVCGNHLATYQQDGYFFDGQGREVEDAPAELPAAGAAAPAGAVPADLIGKVAVLEKDLAETRQILADTKTELAETKATLGEQAENFTALDTLVKSLKDEVVRLSDAAFDGSAGKPAKADDKK